LVCPPVTHKIGPFSPKIKATQRHGAALTTTMPPSLFFQTLFFVAQTQMMARSVKPPGGGAASDSDGSHCRFAHFDGRIANALAHRHCRRHLRPRCVVVVVFVCVAATMFTPFCIIKASLAVWYRRGPWSPSRRGRHITYSMSCACSRRGGRGGGGIQAVDRMRTTMTTMVVIMGSEMTTGET